MLDCGLEMARNFKIVVEQHADGFVAYPLAMKGVVVGEGDSCEEALSDVESAIRFHIETFGGEVLADGSPVIEAFIAETTLSA
jgi:predicted RNase H-like HicB family nuclease